MAELHITRLRAVLAILVGTLVGAAMVTIWLLAGAGDWRSLQLHGLQIGILIFINAAVIWAIALLAIAAPLWIVLHRRNIRNWPAAGILGGGLTFVITLGLLTNGFGLMTPANLSAKDDGGATWVDSRLTLHGWIVALEIAAICAIAGALVGLIVWRVAYRTPAR